MFVSDLRHFLDLPDDTPAPALRLAEQLRDIVRAATAGEPGAGWVSALRCRRRPGHRRCQGRIFVRRTGGQAPIGWACTVCRDEGCISGWQDTPHDLSDGFVWEGTAKDVVVSDDVVAGVRELSLLDADGERVAYRARSHDGHIVLSATDEQLDELLGYLAAEAHHETAPTTASRDEPGTPLASPRSGPAPTPVRAGVPDLDVARVQRWCAARVPEPARHQVRVECEVGARDLTIVERRPPWRDDTGPDWTSLPVARLRYAKTAKTWTLCWRDRHLRFHLYNRLPPSAHVNELLTEIDRDPTHVFWG